MADQPKPQKAEPGKKAAITAGAWQEARGLIYAHRHRLALGFVLLLVNRAAGFVLPSAPKWGIDRVIGRHGPPLLVPPPLPARIATLGQAAPRYGLVPILRGAGPRGLPRLRPPRPAL